MVDIGIILTMRDDFDLMERCLEDLSQTEVPFELVVVDSSKESKVVDYCLERKIVSLRSGNFVHLSRALNAGIDYFLGMPEIKFIGWVHGDQSFPNSNWLGELKRYLEEHEDVGRVASRNIRDKEMPNFELEEPGNELPCLWKRRILEEIWKRDGNFFNEAYLFIGGSEDWSANRKILKLGYKVMITPRSKVFHIGGETRFRRDTRVEQLYNRRVYFEEWGTDQPPV